jgi:hypothetical protein
MDVAYVLLGSREVPLAYMVGIDLLGLRQALERIIDMDLAEEVAQAVQVRAHPGGRCAPIATQLDESSGSACGADLLDVRGYEVESVSRDSERILGKEPVT